MITRILITGGSGFLGSHIVHALAAQKFKIAVLLRQSKTPQRLAGLENSIHIIHGDIGRPEDWLNELKDFAPEAAVHMAWSGVGGSQRNEAAQADNITNTVKLAAALKACGTKHFIGAGSQAEYGPINRRCSEDEATNPVTLYGHAKLAAGAMTKLYCYENDLRFAWLRIFSTYGPGDHDYWLIPYVIKELCAGRIPRLTKCEQCWDYLHVSDAAAAFVSVLMEPAAMGIFNLGSDTAPPLASIITRIRDCIDPKLPVGFGSISYQPHQVMHLQANISRLTKATGWKPRIPLFEGLQETVAWYVAKNR